MEVLKQNYSYSRHCYCEGSDILSYLQVNNLICHIFIDANRRHQTQVKNKGLDFSWKRRQHNHQYMCSISLCSTGMTRMDIDGCLHMLSEEEP